MLKAFLERMRQGEVVTDYRVYGSVELQYDSNVVLAGSEDLARQALQSCRRSAKGAP